MSIITSIRLNIDTLSVEDDVAIHTLMRQQQSAMRVAYNRLADGWPEKDIYHQLKRLFPSLTGWEVNAALALARQTRASQAEVSKRHASYLKTKIEKLRRKRHPKAHERADRLEARLAEITRHIEAGSIPPAIFGGRKLWQKVVRRVPGAREEWRDARSKQYYSLGEAANQYGNRHCRLIETEEGKLQLHLRVGHGRWVEMSIHYSRQFEPMLHQVARQGLKNTLRLMREGAGQYRAVVILDELVEGEVVRDLDVDVVAGVDLNLDHLAIVIVDREGQFRRWRVMRYDNLGELPKAKTRWTVGNLAKQAITWAKAHGAHALVIEDLDIQPAGGSRTQNRRSVPFAYGQLTQALERRALREGLQVKRANPAYTSWIGRLKYSDQYGISTHIAAAYVIGRRGLKLEERIPADLVARFDDIAAGIEATKADPAQKREWRKRLDDWKHHSPEAGHPWLLWATLKGISDTSNGRGSVTWGRNYLPWRRCSAGNTRPGVEPASRAGPMRSEIALSGTVVERQHARPQDKACGPYADEAAF